MAGEARSTPAWRRWGMRIGLGAAGAAALGVVLLWASLRPVESERLRPPRFESLRLFDRHGLALGESLSQTEASASWAPLESVSPDLVAAAVATEDQRFWTHGGLDLRAIVRAGWANLRAGRVVSGASTITQQVARMMLADEARASGGRTPRRTAGQKMAEAHLALRLERSFSKREILEAWLNRAPMGGVALGVTSAAERYFGVHPSALNLSQSALLVGLPRGPTALMPHRERGAAKRRRDRVLRAMLEQGLITQERFQQARAAPVLVDVPRTQPMRARLGAWVARELVDVGRVPAGSVASSVDRQLEQDVLAIVRRHLEPLRGRGVTSASVVVIDHETDELLALVGSADEADPRWGQVHAAFSLRQPGSALKPFVYLAALEQGRTLASLAADVEQAFPDLRGAYLPQNYDRRFHGPVRYRDALAQSLNVAAVDVLRGAGVRAAADVLERAGISTISRWPEYYGLGLTLGSLDVQLIELTEAYAVLARGGVRRPTRVLRDDPRRDEGVRVFDEAHAHLIADALSDANARAPQFGHSSVLATAFWTAVKTGTSKGFRDNYTVGFSRRFTVGVWVGDPTGRPMEQVSGLTGAGPIWRGVMDRLHRSVPSPRPPQPDGVERHAICPLSGARPGPHCPGAKEELFASGTEPRHTCRMHREERLAKADGLPVPAGCAAKAGPPSLATFWPSPFDAWAVERRLGLPDAWSAACPAPPVPEGASPPRLLAPARREFVKIDPDVPRARQQLLLLADAEEPAAVVSFFVDGEPVGERVGPRAALWTVSPGEHRITARLGDAGPESDAHVVFVR